MIRRSTWFLIAGLLLISGFAIYLRNRQAKELIAPTPTSALSPLFGSSLGQPTRIHVESDLGVVVGLSRTSDGRWAMQAPHAGEADQAAAEAAATQVGALRVLSTVQLEPDVIGLDKPAFTLSVSFGEGKEHTVLVGAKTPIQDGYYTRLDGGPFQIVDKAGLDALIGLLTNPPYPATPTPETPPTEAMPPASAPGTATSGPSESSTPGAAPGAETTTATAAP